jgi:hypothetical protein
MPKKALKSRLSAVYGVLGAIAWRGFGLFLALLGASAGTGAVIVGNWMTGVLIAWATLMLGIIGAVGYAIATTGMADESTVAKAAQDAIQKANEQQKK